MTHRILGRTGLKVYPLGFGCANAALLKTDPKAVADMLNELLDQGVNVIDTSSSYGDSEKFLGRHLMHRRGEFVLISKCGQHSSHLPGAPWSYERISASVDQSLRDLQTDRVDVMLLHSCDLATLKKGDVVRALVDARQAGKIAHVGYSGDNDALAFAAAQPEIEVCETSISIADQRNIDHGLSVCREHNVGVLVKRSIANAAWRDLSQQQGFYQKYAKDYTERLRKMNITPADLGFDGEADELWPDIALRFTLSQPGVHVAIIGTTKKENAMSNLASSRKPPLPQETIDQLREAFRLAQGQEQWVGLT